MLLKKATKDDEAAIKELLAGAGLPFSDITPAHLDHFLILTDGEQLAGTAGLEIGAAEAHDTGLLRSLAIHPDFREQGLGSRLTTEIEALAATCGIQRLYLLTTTAENFFSQRGYQLVERSRVPAEIQNTSEFRSLCPESAVCLTKNIAASG